MKKTTYLKLTGMLCISSLCIAMQKAEQAPALDKQDLWVQYQELSQLSEEQQKALILLAEKSTARETEDLLLASQAVVKSSATVVAGLAIAKTTRAQNSSSRRWRLFDTDIKLSAELAALTPEQILERLYTVSTFDQSAIDDMLAQAPQAKTADLDNLIARFGTIQEQLTKFIALVETLNETRENEKQDAEKKSASEAERLKREAVAQQTTSASCIIS